MTQWARRKQEEEVSASKAFAKDFVLPVIASL